MVSMDLRGKTAFVAGVADDNGFGWAIAKALAEAGAKILVGTWPPALKIFQMSLEKGKFDEGRRLSDGSLMEIAGIYPLDAAYDTRDAVPEELRSNKRYQDLDAYTVSEVAEKVAQEHGKIDILVHSLANGPEVKKPLLETSREGYLAAVSASAYSYVSLIQHFGPHMNSGGAAITLSYLASEMVVPGYGGGMSSAKAALESDTRTLAWEAGRAYGIRVNAISAGALGSRAAKAIGFIDRMLAYAAANAPLQRELSSDDVGRTAAFLLSPAAAAITGVVLYVDNGIHAMGVAADSPSFAS
ncbi:MAG: enoyl-[acyl-carrier-protein] reductase [Chlamydiia bacterium]|nr:enoyl-[acyl-carrier-protein] reductase [Chlamydiia bacterium]